MSRMRNIRIPDLVERAFPGNICIGVTHGSSFVPEDFFPRLSEAMRADGALMLSNFSDEGTVALVADYVPRNQVVFAPASRAVGDPNRARDYQLAFRELDFNKHRLWDLAPSDEEKEDLLRRYYDDYHARIQVMLHQVETRNPGRRYVFFDLHDTGNVMMNPAPMKHQGRFEVDPNGDFPDMCLSYLHGTSCDPEIFKAFVGLVNRFTGFESQIDWPYKGGHMIKTYGADYNQALPPEQRFRRNCIQIEVGRFHYVDENTQTLLPEATQCLRDQLMQAMIELGDSL